MNDAGIYNDQGTWVPGAFSVWPTDPYGVHKISVCWEAPTQTQINTAYPGQGIAAAPQAEAAAWINLTRRYVENTWQRASNIVFTGWGPCSYSLYGAYPQVLSDVDANGGRPHAIDLALMQNGQRVHPERHGIHVEIINSGTSFSLPYRGKNGIVFCRLALQSNIRHPWQDVHEFGHALGWNHEDGRSDYCNSYLSDGGLSTPEFLDYCKGVTLPQPVQSGPGLSPTADAHTIMAYVKAPPHQYYFGPGPWSESIAEMGTILSPMDVMGLQSYYGRPIAGSIRGYRGRKLCGPAPWYTTGPVGASLPAAQDATVWTTEASESTLTSRDTMLSMELPGLSNPLGTQFHVGQPNGSVTQRPSVRLARWRAWGNMCLWAESSNEGASIVLDYCTPTLGTDQQNPLYFTSRLYWNEHYQVGNSFQYRLANTNLCAAVSDSTYQNGGLQLQNCDMGDDRQLFMKNDVGQLVPRAVVAGSRNKCLNVLGGLRRPGEKLGLFNCNIGSPTGNDQFFFTEQVQFLSDEGCIDMLNADAALDAREISWADVGVSRCKGVDEAFTWNSTASWDVYSSGSMVPSSRPSLGAGSGPANLGTGLTDRVRGSNFTIEMWVNPDATQSTYANIIDFNHRANVGIVFQQDGSNTNRYVFGMGNGQTSCGVIQQLQANRWQHLNFVRTGTTVSLYVDGSLVQSAPCFAEDVYFLQDSSVTVAYNVNYGRPFAGRYAGMRLWNNVHLPSSIEVGDPDASLAFNGSSDGMSLGNSLPSIMQGDFTIELLVKPAAAQQTYANILDFNHRANVGLVIQQDGNVANRFYCAIGNGSTSSAVSAQLNADRWQSLAFVRRGAGLSLYLDGFLVSQAQGFSGNVSYLPGSSVTVGYNANYGRYFNGQIKVMRISSAAKTF